MTRSKMPSQSELFDLVHRQRLRPAAIAKQFGVSPITVRYWRARLGIPVCRKTVAERLWAHVDRRDISECWEWQGARTDDGYGLITVALPNHFRSAKAHRISWEIANSASLLPGSVIMHSCDNPPCCNPAHLSLGTHGENARDAVWKGRKLAKRGEANGRAILTNDIVTRAKELRSDGCSYVELSARLGVPYGALWNALNGRTWRHHAPQ